MAARMQDSEAYARKGYTLSQATMVRLSEFFDSTNDQIQDEGAHLEYYCNLQPNQLAYLDYGCFANAVYNRDNAYKSKKLTFVVGSLGIGVKPFWQYGCKKYKDMKDFARPSGFDAHGWLEDDNGNVYDYVYPSLNALAIVHDRHIKLKKDTRIEGETKHYLAKRGLHFIKALADIHDTLVGEIMQHVVQHVLCKISLAQQTHRGIE